MKQNMVKHLEMIEIVINRMASNSFVLKGWAVTLAAGIFTLSEKNTDKMYFLATYVPIVLFWFLDSYYLHLERRYINLYNHVRTLGDSYVDYDMDTSKDIFKKKESNYWNCLRSRTEFGFYIPIAVLLTFIIKITHN